jgi:hypothetical protein
MSWHFNRYTGHCRSRDRSVLAVVVQILLRTAYFTEFLVRLPGDLVKTLSTLYGNIQSNSPYLDIDPLIKLTRDSFARDPELPDCLSAIFRLLGSDIPHFASSSNVVYHIPHNFSILQYVSQISPETIDKLGVIFLDVKSVVFSEIPEHLCNDVFSLYVVVTRRSKTNVHLNFRDSEGWLSIFDWDIEAARGFNPANVCLLGYIRDPTQTSIFRNVLTFNHSQHRPVKAAVINAALSSLQDVVSPLHLETDNRIPKAVGNTRK